MTALLVLVFFLVASFGFVLLFGAPYLPTLSQQMDEALDMLKLKKGDTLLELGCGDGKVLIAAAERGYKVVGYELNPVLAFIAWVRTRRYGKRVKVVWGNFWTKRWPPADGIFVFLLDRYMTKLDTKIVQDYKRPVKLISFAFQVPGRVAKSKKHGLFLYVYK